jgi:hypothetical protein
VRVGSKRVDEIYCRKNNYFPILSKSKELQKGFFLRVTGPIRALFLGMFPIPGNLGHQIPQDKNEWPRELESSFPRDNCSSCLDLEDYHTLHNTYNTSFS